MALGVRDRNLTNPAPATMGGQRNQPQPTTQLATAAPAARQPTPQEQADAAARVNASPVKARWDAKTGQYVYIPMDPTEEIAWRDTQYARGQAGTGVPQAPAVPVDPTQQKPAAPPPDQATQIQQTFQRVGAQQPAAANPALAARTQTNVRPSQPQRMPNVQMPQGSPGAQPAAPAAWKPVQQDYGRYDAEAERLRGLQTSFMDQLQKLSGSDPFGNQAALQKATDRAVAQAAGTAASARGGAAALAGAQRQAVGVQAQTSARGAQDIVEQRRRDQQTAIGLGIQAIGGAADIGKQLTANEIAMGDQAVRAAEVNLRGYLGNQELGQREKESLRQFALEASKIDMQRYQTDMQYRAQVDQNLTQRYIAGTQLEAAFAKINADEGIGPADWLMGAVGLAAGGAQAAAIASDERVKTHRERPSTRALREFVHAGDGEFYEYLEPEKPGRRPGRNFGPMAQHLARTEIGRTLVAPDRDGTLRVDTARLALADHSAMTHLAQRLARLEKKAGSRGPRGGRRG